MNYLNFLHFLNCLQRQPGRAAFSALSAILFLLTDTLHSSFMLTRCSAETSL